MNEFCNANKHAILVPLEQALKAFVEHLHVAGVGILKIQTPVWNSTKIEAVLAVLDHGALTPEDTVKVSVQIATSQIGHVPPKPAVPFLNAMRREVERALVAIEGEARRIGLFGPTPGVQGPAPPGPKNPGPEGGLR